MGIFAPEKLGRFPKIQLALHSSISAKYIHNNCTDYRWLISEITAVKKQEAQPS